MTQPHLLRYSSIVPIIDFRNNYEKGYVDQFYGESPVLNLPLLLITTLKSAGKPDQFRLLYKKDFKTDGTAKKNIRLKWIAMCLVMDYVNGEVWKIMLVCGTNEFNIPG